MRSISIYKRNWDKRTATFGWPFLWIAAPFAGAIRKILALPDRRFPFDPVDDVLVGGIGLATMRGGRDHNNGRFAYRHPARPVPGYGHPKRILFTRRQQNGCDHFLSQWSMGFIFQVCHSFTPVIVADFSAKQYDSPRPRMMRPSQHACYVERFGAQSRRSPIHHFREG